MIFGRRRGPGEITLLQQALDGGIVQHKAVRFAQERRLKFEVGGYGSAAPTIVGDVPEEFAESASPVACHG